MKKKKSSASVRRLASKQNNISVIQVALIVFGLLFSLVIVVALPHYFQEERQIIKSNAATNTLSGLPWMSGVNSSGNSYTDAYDNFANYRGRAEDVVTTWEDDGTWGGTENVWELSNGNLVGFPGKLAIAIPMLSNTSNTFSACANGAYDSHFVALGNTLKNANKTDSIIRLGWEGNGDWYAWSVNAADPTTWIACFQREVTALRSVVPTVQIDWNMNKDGRIGAQKMYPGDAYVDIIGVDFYDMYPHYNTQADWDADYNRTQDGGPRGLGSWLAFAQSHGKKLSVPEWGVNNGGGDGGIDNPLYIQNMYNFFKNNAADIAYEAYFNSQCPNFCLNPAGKNPNAAAKYKELWGGTAPSVPTASQPKPTVSNVPSSAVLPTNITPAFVCLGPCPTLPFGQTPSSAPIQPGIPSSAAPTSAQIPTNPVTENPIPAPIENPRQPTNGKSGHTIKNGGLIQHLIDFLKKLLELLLQFFKR